MSKPWFKPFDDNSKDLESAERIIKKHIEKIQSIPIYIAVSAFRILPFRQYK